MKSTLLFKSILSLFFCFAGTGDIAACSASFTRSISGDTVHFTGSFTGVTSSTTISWDFGDGGTAMLANPIHIYPAPGIYVACVTIADTTTGCNDTYCDSVIVGTIPCSASYNYTVSGNDVQFTGSFTGVTSSTTISWDFGDGGTAVLANPVHTYPAPGIYVACVTIADTTTGCNETHCDSIIIGAAPCSATYNYTVSGNDVQFTGSFTGVTSSTTISWDFGDGGTAVLANPVHTYPAPGIYVACVTIADATTGCNNVFCDSIGAGPCDASFTYLDFGNEVYFTGSFTGVTSSATFSWDFGDGGTAVLENPTHTYPGLGSYLVCVTVNDTITGCSDTSCGMVDIVLMRCVLGQPCTDNDPCTISDCVGGLCMHDPEFCFDNDICTIDQCDNLTGCIFIVDSLCGGNKTTVGSGQVQAADVLIYPNPTEDILNIAVDAPIGIQLKATITDITGKLILQRELPALKGNNMFTVDLSEQLAGAYIVRISWNDEHSIFKVLKY